MNKLNKKLVLSILIAFLIPVTIFAQQYQIQDVTYDITGSTREYPLRLAVDIDQDRIFNSTQALDAYIDNLKVQFQNQRVLESSDVSYTLGSRTSENIIPVFLTVTTVDSNNLIIAPYPKYDSNEGFTFKADSKDYNFLGSMQTLDAEFYYEWEIGDSSIPGDVDTHTFGTLASFRYPFAIGPIDAFWNNTLGVSYIIGENTPNFEYRTGLSARYDITEIIAIQLELEQGILYDRQYDFFGDTFYFSEEVLLSMPITLVKTDNYGNIVWTPKVSSIFYWDLDGIDPLNEDLYDTTLDFGHSFALGRVDWVENFKDGFTFSFSQTLSLELNDKTLSISGDVAASYFKAFEHLGIKSRLYLMSITNTTDELGDRVRGLKNDFIDTNSAVVVNFDLPIRVWKTDWVGYGLWDWTDFLDFEMQVSPFFDIALGYNEFTNSSFSPKDGWYGAGLEVVGYLEELRSVQGRVSVGVDVVKFADKVGDRVGFVESTVNSLFNTAWRYTEGPEWYEITIGIGLFY